MASHRRRWPWVVAGIIIGLVLLAGGGWIAAHRVAASAVARLPVQVSYETLRLNLDSRLTLTGVSLPLGATTDPATAARVDVELDLGAVREALAGDLLAALQRVVISDSAVVLPIVGEVRVTRATVEPPRSGSSSWLVAVDGIALIEDLETILARSGGATGAGDAGRQEDAGSGGDAPGGGRDGDAPAPAHTEATLNDYASRALEAAVSLVARLPIVEVTVERGSLVVAGAEAWFRGHLDTTGSESVAASIELGDLSVTPFFGPVREGTLEATLAFDLRGTTVLDVEGSVATQGLVLDHASLAEEPVGPIDASYAFAASLDTLAPFVPPRMARRIPGTNVPAPIGAGAAEDADLRGAFTVASGRLEIGEVSMRVEPRLRGLNAPQGDLPIPTPARIDIAIDLPATPLEVLVASLPHGLLGPLEGGEVNGEFSWRIELEAPPRLFSWTRWDARTQIDDFAIISLPAEVDVRKLAGPFVHRLPDADGASPVVRVASPTAMVVSERAAQAQFFPPPAGSPEPIGGGPRWASLEDIAPAMVGAAITTEDGEFLRHDGVNWLSLVFALEVNLAAGEIVIGGSTIPMQLAQNLFLDGQRLVSRKVQELALVALAQLGPQVTRARILEVYLNIIEFGPGIYGIVEASERYFGVAPRDLSVAQAVWLASIIRSPRRLVAHAQAGAVPDRWLREMASFMDLMVQRGRLSDEERLAAVGRQPGFLPWAEES